MSRRGAAIPGATSVAGDATRPEVVAEALGSGADVLFLAIGGVTGTDTNRADVTRAGWLLRHGVVALQTS